MNTRRLLGIALVISIISCADQDLTSILEESVAIGTVSLNTSLKETIDVSTTGKTATLDEVLDDVSVEIFDATGATVVEDRYRNLPEFIELPVGNYTVVFYMAQSPNVRFDTGAYGSEPQIAFEVDRDANTSVPITLRLFDVATTIDFSEGLLQNFPDISAKVTLTKGDNDFSLEWSAQDNSRTGYITMIEYVPGNGGGYTISTGDLVIELTALDTEGTPILVTRTYPDAVANQHYKLLVSHEARATVDFDITLGDGEIIEDEIPFPDGGGTDGGETSETTDAIVQGDLIITEIMNNPDAVPDTNGEWFELYNTTSDKDIQLDGLTIVGASSEFTVDSELTVFPGSYVVLGRNGDIATNGGVSIDYVYGGFTLANTRGSIAIISEGNQIDQVVYDDFSSEAGKAIQLSQNHLNFTDNDDAINWCVAAAQLDQGDFGTPRAANEICN